ncbi:MAG: hypothetical protein IPN67_11245 [Bacteroidales bacterium]|nr:hypothetical protein [Bacteroidales bacterium]
MVIKKIISAIFLISACFLFSSGISPKDAVYRYSRSISLNGEGWKIAADSANEGREKGWFKSPPDEESKTTAVPWVIQDIFHNYHGVAWYWREFAAPDNPLKDGRCLLRFNAVDYLADIWVNGKYAGGHEGSETPFDLDVTKLIVNSGKNLLVVRVLNPKYEPVDGVALKDTPSGAKQYPFTGNAAYNSGGIVGDVVLMLVPGVRVEDVFVIPDWKTGIVSIRADIFNDGAGEAKSVLSYKVTEAHTGFHVVSGDQAEAFKKGHNETDFKITVQDYKLWRPEDPVLYRIEVSVQTAGSIDVSSLRFGFRDFHFEKGYFRLNGKRIFLKGTNFSTHFPVGYTVPLNEEMLRTDVVNMKALGYNFVRIPFGCPNSRVLDLYDELGIMVQQEHFGCWQIGDYGGYRFPKPENNDSLLISRFEKSISEVLIRERNHTSLVMWGVLNENSDGIIFRKAVEILPSLRELDPSRLFVLNSGRFDGIKEIGSMSNPGSGTWDVREDELKDWHPYVWMPYSSGTLDLLSGKLNSSGQKSYISETGLCFPIDLPSELGDYQLLGKENADDAMYYRRQYNKFLTDWQKFGMGECWASPEDYIRDAYKTAASIRETAEAAIRSNPFVVSYTPTNGVADAVAGESVATNFRRLKPELIRPVLLSNASVRWCMRTEPQSIYSGSMIKLMVSFSNLDLMPPGKYTATVRVFDPFMKPVYEKKIGVTVPVNSEEDEPPFAQSVLDEEVRITGAAGKYQLLASLDGGATVTGGESQFYVADSNGLLKMPEGVVVCGEDSLVTGWLTNHGIVINRFDSNNHTRRQLIVIAGNAPDSLTLISIASQLARGSNVIFLSPSSFAAGKNSTRWLPLANKGSVEPMDAVAGYYRADRWVKKHELFAGIPAGGMMDYLFYRNLISQNALSMEYTVVARSMYTYDEITDPLDYPAATVCGATRISHNYCSGIHLGIWNFGKGQFIVNTLRIAENLGMDPAADRLFCNLLKFGSEDLTEPMSDLPPDFDNTLIAIGYKK